jgi:flagellar export protein FliJ
MPKPNFPLHPVQQLRQAERDQHRQQLLAVRASEAASQAAVAHLRQRLEQLHDCLRGAVTPGVLEIADLRALKSQQQALRDQLRERQRRREELSAQSEQQRAALAQADREVRVLERLAERYQLRSTPREE